jgi:hypothetical protein
VAGAVKKSVLEGKSSALGAKLTDSRIAELAKRESVNDNIKKGGPKTEEGKKRSLEQLRPKNKKGIDVDSLLENLPEVEVTEFPDKEKLPISYLNLHEVLNEDEQTYYLKKWIEYNQEFEMNTTADEALLHLVVMEEIVYNRLYVSQLNNPGQDLSKQLSESVKRHTEALKNLGISRTQRLGKKTGKEDNIASLIQSFDKDRLFELQSKEEDFLKEEEELMSRKNIEIAQELQELGDAKKETIKGEAIKPFVTKEEIAEKAPRITRIQTLLDSAVLK